MINDHHRPRSGLDQLLKRSRLGCFNHDVALGIGKLLRSSSLIEDIRRDSAPLAQRTDIVAGRYSNAGIWLATELETPKAGLTAAAASNEVEAGAETSRHGKCEGPP